MGLKSKLQKFKNFNIGLGIALPALMIVIIFFLVAYVNYTLNDRAKHRQHCKSEAYRMIDTEKEVKCFCLTPNRWCEK